MIGGYALGAALPFVDEYRAIIPTNMRWSFLPSNPDIMYAGCDGGVSKTLDNTASNVVWEEKNLGYITSQFYTVTLDHGGNSDVIIGGLQDNGTYYSNDTNATADWFHSFDGDGSFIARSPTADRIIISPSSRERSPRRRWIRPDK